MTITQASHIAYAEYEKHIQKGEGGTVEAVAKMTAVLNLLLHQVEIDQTDPAAFDEDEQAMCLYGTGRL